MRDPSERRGAARSALLLPVLIAAAGASFADQDGATVAGVRPPLAEEPAPPELAARRALDRGLDYLSLRLAQNEDGSFPRGVDESREWAPVGTAALGALAFMAGGSPPGRGPHGDEVTRIVRYLLRQADLSPQAPHPGYIANQGDSLSRTHGHGYATLALAEALGMWPATGAAEGGELRRAVQAAVGLIERSQGAEGGWEYEPYVTASHEGSVTVCYLQALRAARNAGILVDSEVVRRAEDYVHRLQRPDGLFRYTLTDERATVALTAASITTLNMAGSYDDEPIRSGVDAIWRELSLPKRPAAAHPEYERLYLAQAFWQLGDTSHFERWFLEEREDVLRRQEPDGSWRNPSYGDCYGTAMNCLVLAIPEGVLPSFQR